MRDSAQSNQGRRGLLCTRPGEPFDAASYGAANVRLCAIGAMVAERRRR
ncbi:hypothetical protein LG3211_3864 [Lysobacter gummosus]|nr:hypothetical protein LG3211_3864 [Lysobacter gummosus]